MLLLFLIWVWVMYFLVSFILRSIVGYQRQKVRRDSRQANHGAANEKVEPDNNFLEKFGPPVETFQDPVCGVYVPETAAVSKNVYGRTLYFCCEKCAKAYLAEHSATTERQGVRPEINPSTA